MEIADGHPCVVHDSGFNEKKTWGKIKSKERVDATRQASHSGGCLAMKSFVLRCRHDTIFVFVFFACMHLILACWIPIKNSNLSCCGSVNFSNTAMTCALQSLLILLSFLHVYRSDLYLHSFLPRLIFMSECEMIRLRQRSLEELPTKHERDQ